MLLYGDALSDTFYYNRLKIRSDHDHHLWQYNRVHRRRNLFLDYIHRILDQKVVWVLGKQVHPPYLHLWVCIQDLPDNYLLTRNPEIVDQLTIVDPSQVLVLVLVLVWELEP